MMKNFTRVASTAVCMMATAFGAMAVDHLQIIGAATPGGWEIANGLLMVQAPDNTDLYFYTGWLEADQEFKFTAWHNWDKPELEYRNVSDDPYDISQLITGNVGADKKFKVAESANYDVVCDLAAMTVSVTKSEYQDKPIRFNGLFLVGNATEGGWECKDATPLSWGGMDAPFKFTFTGELKNADPNSGEFKITTNPFSGWGGPWFYVALDRNGNPDYGKISSDGAGDRKWLISETQSYDIAIDLEAGTISVVPTSVSGIDAVEAYEECAPVYYNMQGVIVTNPSNGIFIKKAGNKVSKVVL